jgi:hypothetical protein
MMGGSLGRGLWALDRFGLSPKKLPARTMNRTQPKILCVSIPKSGTHLVERALCLHPRLYRRLLPMVKSTNLGRWKGLDNLLAPVRPGQLVMAHLPFEDGYPQTLASRDIKALFVIRDPRDVVVSEAHYVSSDPKHRGHELFARQATFKDMLMLVIRGDEEHGWLPMAETLQRYDGWLSSGALVLRFEDLIGTAGGGHDGTQRTALSGMFAHIGLPVDDAFLSRVGGKLFSKRSPTFRKGAIGTWSEAFDDEVREAFDQTAGPFLERYGYALRR